MSFWSQFPFARSTIALITGILLAHCYKDGTEAAIIALVSSVSLFLLILIFSPIGKRRLWGPVLGIISLASLSLVGYLRTQYAHIMVNRENSLQLTDQILAYKAIVTSAPVESTNYYNVEATIHQIKKKNIWETSQSRVRLSFPKTFSHTLAYGTVLLIQGTPSKLPPPKNPFEFDYATFLSLSQITHGHFLDEKKTVIIGNKPPSIIKKWALEALSYCDLIFTRKVHNQQAKSVIAALVLGRKNAINEALKTAYSGTGTMHILAVSGLHVGILYGIISFVMGILRRFFNSSWPTSIIAIAILWFYAFMTGLSPSVLRAALMFTLVIIAPLLARRSNIYNTLAASAFLLLYWKPTWLFSVGFQLSYAAVWGIIYMQPKIQKWVTIQHPLLKMFWGWTSVSLAAQIATLPISLYYFHQLPTYFIIANWLVIPAAFLIFSLGLVVLLVSFSDNLSDLFAYVLEMLVMGVNYCIASIYNLPLSTLNDIYIDLGNVILLYVLLILISLSITTRRLRYIIASCFTTAILLGSIINTYLAQSTQYKAVFYSINNHQAVLFIKENRGYLCTDEKLKDFPKKYAYHIRPSLLAWRVAPPQRKTFKGYILDPTFPMSSLGGLSIAHWNGRKFLFIQQRLTNDRGIKFESLNVDYVILENNALNTLAPLLAHVHFSTLIIGTSNSVWIAKKLREEAQQRGIKVHDLRTEGAIIIS